MNVRRFELFKLIQIKFHRELRWSTAQVAHVPAASSLARLTGLATPKLGSPPTETGEVPPWRLQRQLPVDSGEPGSEVARGRRLGQDGNTGERFGTEMGLEAHPRVFSTAAGLERRGSAMARRRSAPWRRLMVRRVVRYPWGARGGVGQPRQWPEVAGIGEVLTTEEAACVESSGWALSGGWLGSG
jgi:hypothetical protein